MATKKKTAKKTPSKLKLAPTEVTRVSEMCMRWTDKSTVRMSDNPKFKKYDPEASKLVPEGMKRVDASTVLPV